LRRSGATALHFAAAANHVEVAQVLLQHGANVKAKAE
jgi:ankyrin repeat protein